MRLGIRLTMAFAVFLALVAGGAVAASPCGGTKGPGSGAGFDSGVAEAVNHERDFPASQAEKSANCHECELAFATACCAVPVTVGNAVIVNVSLAGAWAASRVTDVPAGTDPLGIDRPPRL